MTFRLSLLLCAAVLLAGCIKTYRMDIAQGNIITQEMVDQLRPGMTRSQVRFIMGTPLIADPFHANRWDYFYSLRRGQEDVPQTRHVVVMFKNDVVTGVEGDLSAKPADGNAKN